MSVHAHKSMHNCTYANIPAYRNKHNTCSLSETTLKITTKNNQVGNNNHETDQTGRDVSGIGLESWKNAKNKCVTETFLNKQEKRTKTTCFIVDLFLCGVLVWCVLRVLSFHCFWA